MQIKCFRCIDITLDNQAERVQGLRLSRHLLHTAPNIFPEALARCILAIAKDGDREHDRLLRSALGTLNELGKIEFYTYLHNNIYNIYSSALYKGIIFYYLHL